MKANDRIRLTIESRIRNGELLPGTLIDELSLAAEFKVSKTPVREALLHMKAEGLVESSSRTGMSVAKLTIQGLLAIWELMAEMEALAAKWACKRMTDEERLLLKQIHQRAGKVVERNDAAGWREVNHAFHTVLYDGCRNPFIREELIRLRLRTAGYLKQAYGAIGRAQASYEQHGELLDAILARDSAQAAEKMMQHISLAHGARGLAEILIRMPASLLEEGTQSPKRSG